MKDQFLNQCLPFRNIVTHQMYSTIGRPQRAENMNHIDLVKRVQLKYKVEFAILNQDKLVIFCWYLN